MYFHPEAIPVIPERKRPRRLRRSLRSGPKVVTMDTKFGMGAVGGPVGAYLAVLGAQFEPVGARRPEDRETT